MAASPGDTLIRTDKLGRCKCKSCGTRLDVSDFRVFEPIQCPECGHIGSVPGKLGDFLLLREIGRGGMGSVFLAKDAKLNRNVALKVLNARYGKNPVFVDSLLKEAKAAAILNHRNIVHIFSFGQVHQQPYIVMELVDGIQLEQSLESDVALDEEGWLEILLQLCNALRAAQQVGLVHGDIKPANILLDETGTAKLSDFGIARFEGEAGDRILGTPLYIAPEKARGHTVDHRADQYSLGVCFWQLMTKTAPFEGKTAWDLMLNRFEKDPPDPRTWAPQISERCATLLMRMMAVQPEDRFPDFDALRLEIEDILEAFEEQRAKAGHPEETLIDLPGKNPSHLKSPARPPTHITPNQRILILLLALGLLGGLFLIFQ